MPDPKEGNILHVHPDYLAHRAKQLKDEGRKGTLHDEKKLHQAHILEKMSKEMRKRGHRPKEENAPGAY